MTDELHHTGKHEMDAELEEQTREDRAQKQMKATIVGHVRDTNRSGETATLVVVDGQQWLHVYSWDEGDGINEWYFLDENGRAHIAGLRWTWSPGTPFTDAVTDHDNSDAEDAFNEQLDEFKTFVDEERNARRIDDLEAEAVAAAKARLT